MGRHRYPPNYGDNVQRVAEERLRQMGVKHASHKWAQANPRTTIEMIKDKNGAYVSKDKETKVQEDSERDLK